MVIVCRGSNRLDPLVLQAKIADDTAKHKEAMASKLKELRSELEEARRGASEKSAQLVRIRGKPNTMIGTDSITISKADFW